MSTANSVSRVGLERDQCRLRSHIIDIFQWDIFAKESFVREVSFEKSFLETQ